MPRRKGGEDGEGGPERLKRERPGSYRTADGRFTVEQAGTGWMVVDAEQTNELGLPLVRGPFATLDEARDALAAVRSGPPPVSQLGDRAGESDDDRPAKKAQRPSKPASKDGSKGAARQMPTRPTKPAFVVREMRVADGPSLRSLWAEAEFRSLGDDDLSLARLVRRNPGLALVAVDGRRIVASALGAWDGRRGWIYHVATAESHRRQGVAARLVSQVEDNLRALGCPKVNVIVRDENDDGARFWRELGYEPAPARQFGKALVSG